MAPTPESEDRQEPARSGAAPLKDSGAWVEGWRTAVGTFLACLAVSVLYTFPLILALPTHFPSSPSDEDVFGFIWNNWWISYSILERHQSPWTTTYLFSPFEVDLRLHTFGLLYGVLSMPVTAVAGPVVALNLQALLTPTLNGYFAFVLARYLTRDVRAAFVAGLAVSATPAINFHIGMGRVSCAALWPAIGSLYAFLRLLDRPRIPQLLLFSTWLWALLLIDQQMAMFGALWLTALFLCLCLTRAGRTRILDRRAAAATLLAVALALPGASWLYLQPFWEVTGYTVPAASEAETYSYPFWLLWTPWLAWRVYGAVLIGGLLSALVIAGRLRALLPWLIGAGLFVTLSFGPGPEDAAVRRPFALLRDLVATDQFRTPYRFQIPAALGAAMCLAFVLAWLRTRLNRRLVAWGLTMIAAAVPIDLLFHRTPAGFQVQTLAPHPVYATIAADPEPGIVLEVPFGVRSGTDRIGIGERLNFHQPFHRKRMINGMIARVPLEALYYYRRSPALMLLAADAPVPSGDLDTDLRARLDELAVRHVVVHPAMLDEERKRRILDLFAGVRELEKRYEDREVILFVVETASHAR
jgi:hypothetical protein